MNLNRVRDGKETYERLLTKVEELTAVAEKMTKPLTGMPRGGNSKTDDPWALLADYKTELAEAMTNYLSDCRLLEEELNCINNPKINVAMKYKYIDCYSIANISKAMDLDERWVRRLLAKGRKIYEREHYD